MDPPTTVRNMVQPPAPDLTHSPRGCGGCPIVTPRQEASCSPDPVDLKLAESYAPLCYCILKCCLVLGCHAVLRGDVAHTICAAMLALDRVCNHANERVVDTNTVSWGVLSSFLTLSSGMPLAGGEVAPHIPSHASIVFSIMVVASSLHLIHNGTPFINSNPAMAFAAGVGASGAGGGMPRREWAACIVTAMVSVLVCDRDVQRGVFGRDAGAMMWMSLRSMCYVLLSCMWAYTVVLLGARSSASTLARVTPPLTATRFLVVMYTPTRVSLPLSCLMGSWMIWVCLRHRSRQGHPKRSEEMEVARVMSQLYSLEQAAEAIHDCEAPRPVACTPAQRPEVDIVAEFKAARAQQAQRYSMPLV